MVMQTGLTCHLPGYALFHDDKVIYMGSACEGQASLLTSLRGHCRGDIDELTIEATHFVREVHSQPEARLAALLRSYQAAHGGDLPTVNQVQAVNQAQAAASQPAAD